MKRVLIIGDSLSLPNKREKIHYADTYAGIMDSKNNCVKVKLIAEMGNDSQLVSQSIEHSLENFTPQLVIIQLGIVDCASRVFSRKELDFVVFLPNFIQEYIHGITRKYRYFITKIRKINYVSLTDFENNYRVIIEKISRFECQMIFVNIVHVSNHLCAISYNMRENIHNYNEVIYRLASKNNCRLIDLNRLTLNKPNLLATDGYHLSIEGNHQLFKQLKESL